MSYNYLKLAIRLLVRNPFFTFLNATGLAIGFASFFALWQYSTSELKADQHHKDFERIARIGFNLKLPQEDGKTGFVKMGILLSAILPQIGEDFPEIESYVRISEQAGFFQKDLHTGHGTRIVLSHQENGNVRIFEEKNAAYADRNLFTFFTVPLIYGDPETILSAVNNVALSESNAIKFFGDRNPLGEQILLNDSIVLKVTGVFSDLPPNSRLKFDLVISNEGLITKWSTAFWGGTLSFVKLNKGTNIQEFSKKLNENKTKYFGHLLSNCRSCDSEMFAQPLREVIFTHGYTGDDPMQQQSRAILLILGTISIIVLVMGWINNINLSVSALSRRLNEFDTRRANGAGAADLIKQLLIESLLVNVLALAIAFTILQVVRAPLETVLHIRVAELNSIQTTTWMTFAFVILAGVFITGLFPAYLWVSRTSSPLFHQKAAADKIPVKSWLTTIQFSSAIMLILWASVVFNQLNFILEKDTGMNRDGILIVEGPVTKTKNYAQDIDLFLSGLNEIPGISHASSSRYMVGEARNKPGNVVREGTDIRSGVDCNGVDENFIPGFGIKIVAGRNFIRDELANAAIISLVAAKFLGFENPDDAIGARIGVQTGDWGEYKSAQVIGVVQDYRLEPYFNFSDAHASLSEDGTGLLLTYKNKLFPDLAPEYIALTIDPNQLQNILEQVEPLFKRHFPGNLFGWRFMNDQINQAYANEKILRNQIVMFALLAIVIACLGLIAMISYRAQEKIKEIGIRKILGATSLQIGAILLRTTAIQFLIGTLIGVPVAYYLGQLYLEKYSERIPLTWWYGVVPVSILLVILLMAVSSIVWRSSTSNPVTCLRHE